MGFRLFISWYYLEKGLAPSKHLGYSFPLFPLVSGDKGKVEGN